jgi:hypothetical protein
LQMASRTDAGNSRADDQYVEMIGHSVLPPLLRR